VSLPCEPLRYRREGDLRPRAPGARFLSAKIESGKVLVKFEIFQVGTTKKAAA